jgi:hypothetical protein
MANLKIIWTTGAPFSGDCREKIGYQINSENWNIYTGSYWVNQTASVGEGNRPATAEEIEKHWDVLHPMWTPESGDKVIVTQDIGNWHNKRGTIVAGDGSDHYWIVKRDDDGCASNFMKKNQMILAPYEETVVKLAETSKSTSPESRHGFTIGDVVIPDCDNFKGRQCIVKAFGSASVGVHCPSGAGLGGHTLEGKCPDNTGRWYIPSSLKLFSKEEPETVSKPITPSTASIPLPKEGYITVRVFTEEEFKSKDLWDTFGSRGCPRGWNTDGYMNEYLGRYLQISNRDFKYDNTDFKYAGWTFKDTDYEVIHGSVEPKPEAKVEAKPEMKAKRFKVGDEVTYKSRPECSSGGYQFGGKNQGGYVGTIVSYKGYYSNRNCYEIIVTSKEGGIYNMLECEFYEYDGLGLGVKIHKSTSENIGIGTSSGTDFRVTSSGGTSSTNLLLDTWKIQEHGSPSVKEVDELAKYNQAPITLHKKPKRKLIIANTY